MNCQPVQVVHHSSWYGDLPGADKFINKALAQEEQVNIKLNKLWLEIQIVLQFHCFLHVFLS